MKVLRTASGVCALLGVAVALNFLLLKEDFFVWPVLLPLIAGLAAGAIWLGLSLWALVGSFERGKTLEGLNLVLASIAFLGICIALYAFVKRVDWAWDLTREGRRELSEQTVQVLERLDVDVEVLCLFVDTGDRETEIAKEKTRRFLERCRRHTARLSFVFVDPQRETDRLRQMGVTHSAPQGTCVLRTAEGASKAVSLRGTPPRLEELDFTNTLINVTREGLPKVCFLTGHGERADATVLRRLLQAESYVIEDLAIRIADPDIPPDCDILVINRLESNLDPREIAAIQRYLDDGGRLLALVDVTGVAGGGPVPRMLFLAWLEQRYGIVVGDDVIVSKVGDRFGMVDLLPDAAALSLFNRIDVPDVEFHGCYDPEHPVTRGFNQKMSLAGARSVTVAAEPPGNVVASEILRTLPYAWAEKRLEVLMQANPPPPKQDPDELAGSIGVAVAATARTDVPVGDSGAMRDARIVVVGDTDLTTNESVLAAGHLNFLLNAMAWLSQHEELIGIRPTGIENEPILLTERDEQAIAWLATLGLVQLVVVAGLAAYALRRKYR
ncbi:MAG: GldG family protein [Candidatus Hydrogenedentes bacterium]|nr:GldG family protein [Candidatus Hydrogenedentota bacterium]